MDSVLIFLFLCQTNTLSVRFKAQEREKVSVFPDFRTNVSIAIILHKHHLMPARTMSVFEYFKYIWNVCAHLQIHSTLLGSRKSYQTK